MGYPLYQNLHIIHLPKVQKAIDKNQEFMNEFFPKKGGASYKSISTMTCFYFEITSEEQLQREISALTLGLTPGQCYSDPGGHSLILLKSNYPYSLIGQSINVKIRKSLTNYTCAVFFDEQNFQCYFFID